MNPHQRQRLLVSAALVVLLLTVYWQVTGFDFVIIDDGDYAKDNPHICTGITLENLRWVTTASVGANWHPLTVVSHMLDNTLYGSRPGLHHLTSVIIHIINTVLLLGVLLSLTKKTAPAVDPKSKDTARFWVCAVVTASFALHPLRAESVAWISERKDVLSAFFFLLTLWSYIRYTDLCGNRNTKRKAWLFYIASVLFLTLGLMSKAMLVTVPCVFILLDYWPLYRLRDLKLATLTKNALEKVPFFIISGAFCFITFFVQKQSGTVIHLSSYPLSDRVANAVVSYSRYLGSTFWPVDLAAFYPYHLWEKWQVAAAVLVFVAISLVCLLNLRRRPYLFVGWFFFAGMLVPVIGISQVGGQAMADRYTYIPHIGLFLGLIWFAFESSPKIKPTVLAICGSVLALACVPLTYAQVALWKNSTTIIESTLHRTKDNAEANFFLAAVKQQDQKYEEALVYYKEALRLRPNLLDPICGLGNVYDKLGRRDLAEAQYLHALDLDPHFPLAIHCLADVYRKNGKIDESLAKYYEALKYKQNVAEAHFQIGSLLEIKHDIKGAIEHFQEAIRLKPTYNEALNDLAWALATQRDDKLRDGATAARLAAQAVSLTQGRDPGTLDTLAAALAEEGKFSEAAQAATTALTLAQSAGDTNLVAEIASRRKLYESQRPYRE